MRGLIASLTLAGALVALVAALPAGAAVAKLNGVVGPGATASSRAARRSAR